MDKKDILEMFKPFAFGSEGIGTWLTERTSEEVFNRLARIDTDPLSKVQLSQLFVLAHEAAFSDGFYQYFWLATPTHPYDVTKVAGFDTNFLASDHEPVISSCEHLFWGLRRLYIDGLLFYGNIRTAYRNLRQKTFTELQSLFTAKRFDTTSIRARGPALNLHDIPKDHRYLISEFACKSYNAAGGRDADIAQALQSSWEEHVRRGGGRITVRQLLDKENLKGDFATRQLEFQFTLDDVISDEVSSASEVAEKCQRIALTFAGARAAALKNTDLYLSMVNDLDVYVATSMRKREHFRTIADFCESLFRNPALRELHLRYFDPTLSAAEGHEDKGLIECFMVKSAKALVYTAGEEDTYGKVAEAAMALSLGKPVIFYCDKTSKERVFRDIHPLSRLIDFSTGVAVGAFVATTLEEVAELLSGVFENRLEYDLEQHPDRPGYLRLRERKTKSVVRVQTNDQLLTSTFWNHYHNRPHAD